ncbi:MAG: tetratricopeptide repeat protein [Trebonia sp.]|jgi:tetratricopeptide (TPR) repeat protein
MSVEPEARGKQQAVAGRDAFATGRDLTVTIVEADAGEAAVPGLLPRDVPGFTGRGEELARLASLAGGGRVVVTAIGGTAGVGKTALAVHAAHQLLGEFPDGHLYADLRGYSEGQEPVEPGEVLGVFLRSLGVPAEDVPADVEERSGLLRQRLAARRVLMVLDNTRTEAQIRPLLPGAGDSLVLITSRSVLPGLEADERIGLDVLTKEDAVTMLAGLGGHRAAADPTAVAEVARLCGRLPLALRIAGQLLAAHPTWPVVSLTQLLAAEQHRLYRLGAGDLQARAAYEVSYQQLAEEDARLFRLLGLHPGPDFTVGAAAALGGIEDEAAESELGRLAAAHLVVEDTVGRFALHDLLRLFARATCEQLDNAADRETAETRLVQHYANLAAFLDSCVDPELRTAAEQDRKPLSSMRQALAVFAAERPSLLAAFGLAVQRGWDEEVRRLSESMGESLRILRYLDDLLMVREAALVAARHGGDAGIEGSALNNLGLAYRAERRFEEAVTSYRQALAIFHATGDQQSEGAALDNLGSAYRELGRFEDACASHQQALAIFGATGDRHGHGGALNNLGNAYRELGRFSDAIASYQQALAILQEVGDRQCEGMALNNLGRAYQQLGRFGEAVACYQRDIEICREAGDRLGEGRTLNNLGRSYQELRQFEEAVTSYQQSLAMKREAGDQHGAGRTLQNLGRAYQELRRFEEATDCYQQALAIFRETDDRYDEGKTMDYLGGVNRETRRPDRATACWREAAAAMRAAGDPAEAARLEELAATNALSRPRRWWQRAHRSAGTT